LDRVSVGRCNSDLIREIWVPTAFNVKSMAKAGVTKPLLAMPESLDVFLYDPMAIAKSQQSLPRPVQKVKVILFPQLVHFLIKSLT